MQKRKGCSLLKRVLYWIVNRVQKTKGQQYFLKYIKTRFIKFFDENKISTCWEGEKASYLKSLKNYNKSCMQ